MRGEPRVVGFPTIAVNTELEIPVRGAAYWWPLSIVFTLATDANAADRYVTVEYEDGIGQAFAVNAAAVTVSANSTQRFAGSARRGAAEWNTNTDVLFPLEPVRLSVGETIAVRIAAIQAGDQLSGVRLLVRQEHVAAAAVG